MAYAYRASSSAGNASGGALSINKPAGTVDGDLLRVTFYLESDTNTFSSVPSNWVTGPAQANTGAFKLHTFWKIASSEPASWTWTPTTNAWRAAVCAAYSGALGTGTTRVDVSAGNQGDGQLETNQTAPTVITTVDADLVGFDYGNFDGSNPSAITGFATNLRIAFGSVTIADAIKTPAGATGTSRPNGGVGSTDFAAMHVAYFLDTGGAPAVDNPRIMTLQRGWW